MDKTIRVPVKDFELARKLSPRRTTTSAQDLDELVAEQLGHFSIDPNTSYGQTLSRLAKHLYQSHIEIHQLWDTTLKELAHLDQTERISYFNAKKFLCFQLAKMLDTLQNPFRKTYQSLVRNQMNRSTKGPYPIFDNVTAIFSATPVITRTATYLYACTEWIDQAFQGREMMLEVYSRLLNPTSISLANHIVDLECGEHSDEYMAWNFNSGMAAIDGIMSHLLGHQDIVLSSRNIYGGSYQLLHDWFGRPGNLDIALHFFDGYAEADFLKALAQVKIDNRERLDAGREIYLFMETPCNPHGYVLDLPAICKAAHQEGLTVIVDTTVATPFLCQPFMREDPAERPDFLVHSYTKDITGTGVATAGGVIGRNERMFIPKGDSVTTKNLCGKEVTYSWDQTLFWNVYYVKGAFLDSAKAFDVISGSRTLDLRMLRKAINTTVLARFLDHHPDIAVHCNALPQNPNSEIRKRVHRNGLPAPLFTIDFEEVSLDRPTFTRFFDNLEPAFGHQVSLGQSNTLILCPALTSHSEMSPSELKEAGITPTTIRISVGDEDCCQLIAHLIRTAEMTIDPFKPGFSEKFMKAEAIDALYREVFLDIHARWLDSLPPMKEMLA